MTMTTIEQEYSMTFTLRDFMNQDVTCNKNKLGDNIGNADIQGFTLLGEYKVPKQVYIAIGKRPDIHEPNIGGLFHIELHDSLNNDIEGEFKICFRNNSGLVKQPIIVRHSRGMYKASPTDRSKQSLVKLGINVGFIWAKPDSYVQLWFKPETDGVTVDYDNANNVCLIDYIKSLKIPHYQKLV